MGKRGAKPKGKVKIKWSPNFAYAIGLLASDGCLSKNGRHITLVSKDEEQLVNFMKCLGIKEIKIGYTSSGYNQRKHRRVQFGDVLFYRFLQKIGLTPAKSKTISGLKIPKEYFFDFLRGLFDGDGYTYSYWDKRWRSSFMFYIGFVSASPLFIKWLRKKILEHLGVKGHVTSAKKQSTYYQLKYAKKDGIKIIRKIYESKDQIRLSRKFLKIKRMLDIVNEQL